MAIRQQLIIRGLSERALARNLGWLGCVYHEESANEAVYRW